MKRSFAFAILCLAVVVMLAGSAQAWAPVALWKFDEQLPGNPVNPAPGAILDSQDGHHGTAIIGYDGTNNITPVYANPPLAYAPEPGVPGNPPISALHLNPGYFNEGEAGQEGKIQDRVEVPHSTDFNLMLGDLQDYTIEAIIKTPEITYPDRAPGELPYGGGIITKRGPTGDGWTFRIDNATGHLAMYIQAGWGSGGDFTYPDATGTISVCDNQWHQVAAVIDPNADPTLSSVSFYIDRVLDRTVLLNDVGYVKPWVNWNCANEHDVWIGDFIGRWNDQFVGDMDTVRFSTGIVAPADMLQVPVPEPSSIVLLVAGALALIAVRRVR